MQPMLSTRPRECGRWHAHMSESAHDKCHTFICYRQRDGLAVAEWLFRQLHGSLIALDRSDQTLELDVYFDQNAPAIDDWMDYWGPKLEVCRALLFVCTRDAATRRDGTDWVYAELDYWLEKKAAAPIVIDAVGDGGLYVPEVIRARWPNAQRIVCTPQVWPDDGTRERMERRAIERILHGIKVSEQGVYFKELEHLRDLNRNLQIETARAEQNEERATDARVNLQVNNGARAIDDGDLWGAAVWFSEALRVDAERKAAEDEHRLRLRAVARRLPALEHVWFVDSAPAELRFLPGSPRVLAIGETIEILDPHLPVPLGLEDSQAFVVNLRFDLDGETLVALSQQYQGQETVYELARWNLTTFAKTTLFASTEEVLDFSTAGTLVLESAEGLRSRRLDGGQVWDEPWAVPDGPWKLAQLDADGRWVIAATLREVWVRQMAMGSTAVQLGRFDQVDRIAVDSVAGRWAAVCGHTVNIWHQDGGPASIGSFDASSAIAAIEKIVDVDFNPDGRHFAVTAKQKDGNLTSLIVLSVRSGAATLAGRVDHEQAVERWEFRPPPPPGTAAVAATVAGVSRWNPFERAARFSPDGRCLAAISRVDHHVRVWDWRAGRPLTPPLQNFGSLVTTFAFSNDGTALSVSAYDDTVRSWSFARPTGDAMAAGSRDRVDHLVFSPDGSRIGMAGYQPSPEIWKPHADGLEATLTGHNSAITALAFSPDGSLVATGSYDKMVRVHSAQDGTSVCNPLPHSHVVRGVAFHSASRLLTFCSEFNGPGEICVWELPAGRRIGSLQTSSATRMAAWSPDGTRAAVLLERRSTYGIPQSELQTTSRPLVWDFERSSAIALPAAAMEPEWVGFDDDGIGLWVYGAGQIDEFSAVDGAALRSYAIRSPFSRLLAVSRDGSRIATGKWERQAQVIDRRTGNPLTPQMDHQLRGSIDRGCFSSDGSRLLTISREQVRVWSTRTGHLLAPPFVHDVRVNDALLDASGSRVVISTYPRRDGRAGYPSTIQFWSLEPDTRDVETLQLEAEVASARHIDDAGGLVPLSGDQYRLRCETLSATGSTATLDADIDLWHQQQAASGDEFGRRFHAAQLMTRLGRRIAKEPANIELYRERIKWLKEAGRLDLVVDDQSRMVQLEPGCAGHHVNRAGVLVQLGQIDAALADYTTALALAPDDRTIRERRGQLYAERGDLARALADLSEAFAVHSTDRRHPVTTREIREVYALAYLAALLHDAVTYRDTVRRTLLLLTAVDDATPAHEAWNSLFFAVRACTLAPDGGLDEAQWTELQDSLKRRGGAATPDDVAILAAAIALRRGDHAAAEEALRGRDDVVPWAHLLIALSSARQGKRGEASALREQVREGIRALADMTLARGKADSTPFAYGWPTDLRVAELLAAELDASLQNPF